MSLILIKSQYVSKHENHNPPYHWGYGRWYCGSVTIQLHQETCLSIGYILRATKLNGKASQHQEDVTRNYSKLFDKKRLTFSVGIIFGYFCMLRLIQRLEDCKQRHLSAVLMNQGI